VLLVLPRIALPCTALRKHLLDADNVILGGSAAAAAASSGDGASASAAAASASAGKTRGPHGFMHLCDATPGSHQCDVLISQFHITDTIALRRTMTPPTVSH
jgi:predicted transglutaminase-like cysteine proteinase